MTTRLPVQTPTDIAKAFLFVVSDDHREWRCRTMNAVMEGEAVPSVAD